MSDKSIEDQGQKKLDCLLIPMHNKNLLLPNITVSEVVPLLNLRTMDSQQQGLIGQLDWRGLVVPVFCYEMLNGGSMPPPNSKARFIIVSSTAPEAKEKAPFYAVLTQGIPKLVHVTESDLKEVEAVGMGPMDQVAIALNSDVAMIPDMGRIEETLASQW